MCDFEAVTAGVELDPKGEVAKRTQELVCRLGLNFAIVGDVAGGEAKGVPGIEFYVLAQNG